MADEGSLHVKYRPKTLKEVLGQDDITQGLKKVVVGNRNHVFLFVGPSGVGKTTVARIMANLYAGGNATVANIIERNVASETGKEAMDDLVKSTMFRAPGKSPIRAVILDECHKLSGAAWNTLLKPLEEPPAHVYWFLCTTELGKIPKTVLTRALRYDFKPVAEEAILEVLIDVANAEELDVGDDILETIAEHSNGSVRQALVYLEKCSYAEDVAHAERLMKVASESKEMVELCRYILDGHKMSWANTMRLLAHFDGVEAESIRINVINYLSVVLKGAKDDKRARHVCYLIECFSTPYPTSDKWAPLLISLARATGLED